MDLYSQQPARSDSPQGPNSGPPAPATAVMATKLPALPNSTTPSKPVAAVGGRGGGFDQRLDAMQPKVEVAAAAAGFVNYAMSVNHSVAVSANMGVPAPPIGVQVAHSIPQVGFSFPGGYPMIPPAGQNPPMPPTTPQAFIPPPPLPPGQSAAFYAQYQTFPGQVYPPTAPQPPPPPPRPY